MQHIAQIFKNSLFSKILLTFTLIKENGIFNLKKTLFNL
jgi:hypothetical protein